MELGEIALMEMEGKDHNQAKKKEKGYAKPKEANAKKQTNKSKKGAKRSTDILEIIHSDICCPDMDAYGPKYFISFINDYSRYMYIYLLHNKNEALGAFKVFKAEAEKQCGKQIKMVRTDRGGEYYGRYTEDRQAPVLLRMYILNRVPTKVVPKTPFELWKCWKPSLRHIRVWECPSEVRVYNPQEKKLDPRTISAYFIGYAERSKDQVVQDLPEIVEQHHPQENVDSTLRRSTRLRKTIIPSDYVVYLQESDYDIGAENDLETFHKP
ncbi:Retrovirus-related Pol polyprotein from transposon TNT 1-94 [Vitis vinifera]|uniref:Retrovirus-related Pol polyprotein from transposon TNT 1-94 n=1 Tax=Vitis vinifera TaxID=29760 RepID=A0A438J3J0_VITVI|nr:Retrovirus-related Pol polyprotein from transposon TNT 1-94 [Vitis vinifera]